MTKVRAFQIVEVVHFRDFNTLPPDPDWFSYRGENGRRGSPLVQDLIGRVGDYVITWPSGLITLQSKEHFERDYTLVRDEPANLFGDVYETPWQPLLGVKPRKRMKRGGVFFHGDGPYETIGQQ